MILKKFKNYSRTFVVGFVLLLTSLTPGAAEESIAEMVLNNCKPELINYCSQVTPGRGRIVSCLYAHGDKLSNQCSLAIEVGVLQLNMILSAVNHVVDQCEADLDTYCGDVSLRLRLSKDAIAALEKAIQLAPDDMGIKIQLGNAQLRAKAYPALLNNMAAILKTDPDNASALYLSAHAFLAWGKLVEAKEYTLRLRSKHPNFRLDQRLSAFLRLP